MVLRYALAGAISGYQRLLSPHKGFRCAHRALHGGWSCSEFGRRAVLRFGVLRFLLLQRRRFVRCASAYAVLQNHAAEPETEYKDFPWKQCLKSKEFDCAATGCCFCFPWW
ncbi:membrane protein insertion efficiency factor YidD [Thauera sp. CAU 1555]|uniref:Membrane protein insertion efficiency factor YidD n=1 Tax=Thauera sedimentorum TaxID=2767595 RepID=A0ABR9B927_9RHOO|nr:membrane protein insertion efficiency factor YidD [Thauera sedimentorum]MBD8502676.1 membrane protein insertion efficiency factor YidD [Thauera sedimentorum]